MCAEEEKLYNCKQEQRTNMPATAIFWNKFKIPDDFSTRNLNQGKSSQYFKEFFIEVLEMSRANEAKWIAKDLGILQKQTLL